MTFFQGARSQGVSKPKAKSIAGPSGVGLPGVLRGYRLLGAEPEMLERNLKLEGTTLQSIWYSASADRRADQNGTVCAEFRILSCERQVRSPLLKAFAGAISGSTSTLNERAQRFRCKAELLEQAGPDHLYGRWVRMQGSVDRKELDARMRDGKLVTPVEFVVLALTPSASEARKIKASFGLDVVPGVHQMIAPELTGALPLNDLQIDRFFEIFFLLSWRTRLRAESRRMTEGQAGLLRNEIAQLEVKEEQLLQRLTAAHEELLRKRAELDALVQRNDVEEARLAGRVVPQGPSLAEAEAALQQKREELQIEAVKTRVNEKDRALKSQKKKATDPRSPAITQARTALAEEEALLKALNQQLRPFEERIRAAKKQDRRPQDELERFQRTRKQTEAAIANGFDSYCMSQRGLWTEADRLFLRREELVATLQYAVIAN